MQVLSVSIHVKPEHVEEFTAAMLENARGSRTEPGNLRYDLMRDDDDPAHFLLYEVYQDRAAFDHHLTTPHYHRWSEATKELFAQPAQVSIGRSIFMSEEANG